jgi:hypothetical protein
MVLQVYKVLQASKAQQVL